MNPTIEIKHAGPLCSDDCQLNEGDRCALFWEKFISRVIEHGPKCPGPSRYRLIDEQKIEELWDTLEVYSINHLHTTQDIQDWLKAKGMGRKAKEV